MGFFSELKTFGHWAEGELEKLVGAAPKIEEVVDATLKYVGPALTIIASAIGGPVVGNVVNNVITEAQKDLLAASGLIKDFGANPTATSIIASVQANIAALLTDAHVTDPAHVASVNKIVSELAALVAALTPKTAAS